MKDKETETGTIQCWICPVCFDDHGEREGLCKSEDVAKIISELKAENERLKECLFQMQNAAIDLAAKSPPSIQEAYKEFAKELMCYEKTETNGRRIIKLGVDTLEDLLKIFLKTHPIYKNSEDYQKSLAGKGSMHYLKACEYFNELFHNPHFAFDFTKMQLAWKVIVETYGHTFQTMHEENNSLIQQREMLSSYNRELITTIQTLREKNDSLSLQSQAIEKFSKELMCYEKRDGDGRPVIQLGVDTLQDLVKIFSGTHPIQQSQAEESRKEITKRSFGEMKNAIMIILSFVLLVCITIHVFVFMV